MEFWNRKIRLRAGNKEFNGDDFDIEFSVPFSNSATPDISEITIYNLSNSSIASIKRQAYTHLNVGYGDDVGSILVGNIESVETHNNGVDRVTRIKVSDGATEWRSRKVDQTYKKGVKASYMMRDLAKRMKLEVAEIRPAKDMTYKGGKTFNSTIGSALVELAEDTKSKIFVDKGRLYIREEARGSKTGFVLSSDTGMVGSPEYRAEEDDDGKTIWKYSVSCLLNHRISTDSIIDIKSKNINGRFRVESGEHSDFITSLELVEV